VWALVAVVGMTLAALETQARFRDAMQRPV
jgi:hypothetical protein